MKINKYTDGEVIELIKENRRIESPIRQLYKDYFEGITHFIKKNGGTQYDGEDIFQEVVVVFIDLIQREKFRGDSSIKTFLYAIGRNLWFNELKKRNRTLTRDTEYYKTSEGVDEDINTFISMNESKKQVMLIIDKLGEICKKILIAYYYDSLSMKEIFEKLDYESEQVVRNKKYKCMKQLTELLDQNDEIKMSFKNSLVYGS